VCTSRGQAVDTCGRHAAMLHRPMCTTWGKLAVVVTKLQVRGHRRPTAAVDSFSLRPPGVACLGVSRPPSRLL